MEGWQGWWGGHLRRPSTSGLTLLGCAFFLGGGAHVVVWCGGWGAGGGEVGGGWETGKRMDGRRTANAVMIPCIYLGMRNGGDDEEVSGWEGGSRFADLKI